jgi:ketosteroid isomerase-like protein
MRMRSLFPAAVLLHGCGFHHAAPAPEPARGPARDSLIKLDQSRGDSIAVRGAGGGLFALFGTDVVFLRPGVPTIYGRDAVHALGTADEDSAPGGTTWLPLGGGVSDDLRSGYTFGIEARAGKPAPQIRLDRYIAFWKRTRDQPWRIAAYAEIGAPAGAPPGLTPAALPPPPPRPVAEPVENVIAKIRATDSLFSDLADRMGTPFAFADYIDPIGVLFGTPQLVIGAKAAQELYASQGGGTSRSWRPVYADVAGSLDLGFTVGEYSITTRGATGAAVQRFGKYLTVWKRQRDGSWKFVVTGENGTPAKGP